MKFHTWKSNIGLITSRCSGKEPALLPELTVGLMVCLSIVNFDQWNICLPESSRLHKLSLAVAKKLCDMASDRVSGTSNQISSTDGVMPDLNHSGTENTQNQVNRLYAIWVRIYIWIVLCQMSDNEQSQQREGKTQTSISRKKLLKQIDVYGSLLEGKRHQSLARQD